MKTQGCVSSAHGTLKINGFNFPQHTCTSPAQPAIATVQQQHNSSNVTAATHPKLYPPASFPRVVAHGHSIAPPAHHLPSHPDLLPPPVPLQGHLARPLQRRLLQLRRRKVDGLGGWLDAGGRRCRLCTADDDDDDSIDKDDDGLQWRTCSMGMADNTSMWWSSRKQVCITHAALFT